MLALRCGHAKGPGWRKAARACLERLHPLPSTANLGFLYLTDHFAGDARELLEFFRRETGVAEWVGTVGLGVLATGAEHLDEPAISVMVGAFPEDGYRVFSGKSRPPAADERTASGAALSHFAIVHGDPHTEDMPELIVDMSCKLESGFLVGGLSSSRNGTLQIANEVLSGGLSGVVLSGDIEVRTGLTQGCAPLRGRSDEWLTHRVTECQGNVVIGLDGRPALEVFREDIGAGAARDLNRAVRKYLTGLPVAGSDVGDFLARNIVGIDPTNNLLAIGAVVEKNMPIMFCRRDRAAAHEDLIRMLRSIGAELDGPPKGGLYVACVARGANMFGAPAVEMDLIRNELGDFPVVGFFANGEISHDRLYGYTGVLTLFV